MTHLILVLFFAGLTIGAVILSVVVLIDNMSHYRIPDMSRRSYCHRRRK